MSAPVPRPLYPLPQPQDGGRPLAGWWWRAAAWIIDVLLIFVTAVTPGLVALLLAPTAEEAERGFNLTFFPVLVVFALLYYPVTMSRRGRRNGQTVGRQLAGIRVVRETGEPVTAGSAFVRDVLVKNMLMGFCGIIQLLDFLAPLWDDRNQSWHDKIVHTLVVKA